MNDLPEKPGARVQGKKVHGAAKRVRREDEMTMKRPLGPPSGSSSAWADTFRPSVGPRSGHFMSSITFLSCPPGQMAGFTVGVNHLED